MEATRTTRSIVKMSGAGDTLVEVWEPLTVTPEKLAEIEREFNQLMAEGYSAADITDKRDEIVDKFHPNADYLMIPRMQGGSR